jgi:hypothetical protein
MFEIVSAGRISTLITIFCYDQRGSSGTPHQSLCGWHERPQHNNVYASDYKNAQSPAVAEAGGRAWVDYR